MQKNLHSAQAETPESSAVVVTIAPGEPGSRQTIDIQQRVLIQVGEAIRKVIEKTVMEHDISDVSVKAVGRGRWIMV